MNTTTAPNIAEIEAARAQISKYIVKTPVWQWQTTELKRFLHPDTSVFVKLELFQRTGTFKPRGALINVLNLDAQALSRGITAVSAGNHAIAVAFASSLLNTTAKVVMPSTANPNRIQKCRSYGAEVILVDDVSLAFAEVERIEREEGRVFVHPFEGKSTITGTATVGLELCEQLPEMDAVIIPIGGGGLCAGIAAAVKQLQPNCLVFGVEPIGADTMYRSLREGSPQTLDKVNTIADSLGAPYAAPYSMGICQQFVDEVVLVSDQQIKEAMGLIFQSLKLGVEPAGAASTAALCGPLAEKVAGKRVGIIACGANTDIASFANQAIDYVP